jgi:hypothetical protein
MIRRLIRSIKREPKADWFLVLMMCLVVIPSLFGIGLSLPLPKDQEFSPFFNPVLTIGFILTGQMMGFFATAWKRGCWEDALVNPKAGTVLKTMASNFRSDKVALVLLIGLFTAAALALQWVHAEGISYIVFMAAMVMVSMNSYKRAAWYANPEGLTRIDPKEALKFKAENKL